MTGTVLYMTTLAASLPLAPQIVRLNRSQRSLVQAAVLAVTITAALVAAQLVFTADPVNWLEVAAVGFSFACTWLCVKQVRFNYVLGVISTALLSVVFWQAGLLGSMALNLDEQEALASTRQEHERLRSDHAVLTAQLASARAALEKTRSLDAECVTCHQAISADHRHTQEQMHLDTVDALQAKLDSTVTDLTASADKLKGLETTVIKAQRALTDAQLVEQQVVQTVGRVGELERTAAVLVRRRDALPLEGEPVDVVASERMSVEGQINSARAAELALLEWERGTNAVAAAKLSVDQATLNLDRARAALAGTEIPTDLLEAVERLSALANQLAAEQELLNALEIEAIRAEQHLATAQDRLDAAEAETARRKKLMDEAEEAEAASRLLNVTASKVTGRIRPSLEGATSAILSTMSEGRFDSVSIANDYSISVRDDGALHPMEELSGGEQDLAALALRLGLAAVVAARHGSPGPGFLVLDEVFGSQDAARRESILSGLRALRRSYPQILLVSHVEGAEDQVDSVLTVERVGDDDGTSVADAVVTSQ